MDETTFRILGTLSRELGKSFSINELTNKISTLYGTAYYKNIYDKIAELKNQKIISLIKTGKSKIIELNLDNDLCIYSLAEMELLQAKKLLEKQEFGNLINEINIYFRKGHSAIDSISLISAGKNIKLNKAEFLFVLTENKDEENIMVKSEINSIYSLMEVISKNLNVKTEFLILEEKEFTEIASSDEENHLNSMLYDKIVIRGQLEFWTIIAEILNKGHRIKLSKKETDINKLDKKEILFNLQRFGYTEIGANTKETEKISIENIVTATLINKNVRHIEAIPVLLAKSLSQKKQRKVSYNLLIYLCQKYAQLEKLMGLLEELQKILPTKETEYALKVLQTLKIKPKKADEKAIMEKMRLYNAV